MAVDALHYGTKGLEFAGQRLQRYQVFGGDVGLEVVAVHHDSQVIYLVGAGYQQGLPAGALVQLAVAGYHDNVLLLAT